MFGHLSPKTGNRGYFPSHQPQKALPMAQLASLIEFLPVSGLIPYARNARTHSADQVADIAGSMRRWGWTMPVLIAQDCAGVPDGSIIAGHGRVMAAEAIYAEGGSINMANGTPIPHGQVPVIFATGWDEQQRRAYVIADNQLGLASGWDESILRLELIDLRDGGFNLSALGFEDDELAGLLDVRLDPEADPDEVPEVPAVPVSRPGDVWICGRHRVLCGDATSLADVAVALDGAEPHLMVTDPPYGVDYDPEWRVRTGINLIHQVRAEGVVNNDNRVDWTEAWKLFPGDVVYCWHGGTHAVEVAVSLETAGFVIRSQIIWDKQTMVIGRGNYHWQHEPCWYAVRKGQTAHWNGDRTQVTVWPIQKVHRTQGDVDDGRTVHSTQKPVECMDKPMQNNSVPGEWVYDPFLGSGTTLIAAELNGRKCVGIEINPAYVDVIVTRWQNVTGQKATLEGDLQTFEAVREDRQPVTSTA